VARSQFQIGLQAFFRGCGRQDLLSKFLALLISAGGCFAFPSDSKSDRDLLLLTPRCWVEGRLVLELAEIHFLLSN
jgi:hypothetical protein